MGDISSIEPVKSLTLELPPSCIEFWPSNEQFAIVGTYNLEKGEDKQKGNVAAAEVPKVQERNGSLILLHVQNDDASIIQTFPTPSAILDLHFAPRYHLPSVFGVATSTGSIDLYQLTDAEGKPVDQPIGTEVIPQIKHLKTIQYVEKDILITAFSWYPHDPRVGMSLSNGQILVASTAEDDSTDCVFTHDLEAWTLAFTPDGQGVYSGGDDSVLSYSSEISGLQEPHLRSSWADRRIHEAGVTAILPLQGNPDKHLVVTGSYDDRIRLLEIPSTGRRKVLAEANLGGGVWRLKALVPITFDSTEEGLDGVLLLASCMHAGARILRLSRSGHDDWHFEVLAKFDKHKSMNYGSDCQSQATERGQRTFVTTSFYDRLLCLWRY